MRVLRFAFAIICILLLGSCMVVYAHEENTSGSIRAEMHIEPADSPSVGNPSRIEFFVEDLNHKFSAKQCDCTVMIHDGSNVIFSKNISDPSFNTTDTVIAFTYIFPAAKTYDVMLAGTSTTQSFAPFALMYDAHVVIGETRSTFWTTLIHHSFHIFLFALAILIGIIFTVIDKISEKKKSAHNLKM